MYKYWSIVSTISSNNKLVLVSIIEPILIILHFYLIILFLNYIKRRGDKEDNKLNKNCEQVEYIIDDEGNKIYTDKIKILW